MSRQRRDFAGVGGTAAAAALIIQATGSFLCSTRKDKCGEWKEREENVILQTNERMRTVPEATGQKDDGPFSSRNGNRGKSIQSVIPIPATTFAWVIFWDLENVAVPRGVSGNTVVHALRKQLCQLKPSSAVVRIVAAGNMMRLNAALRNQLQANGVTLVHVETRGRKDASDKALIAELCLLSAEQKPPFGIALLSGDGDFSYALARMRHLGYHTVVIASNKSRMCSALLESVPHVIWGLKEDILGADQHEQNALVQRGSNGCAEMAVLRRRLDSLTREVQDIRKAQRGKGGGRFVAGNPNSGKGGKKKLAPRKRQPQYTQRGTQGPNIGEPAAHDVSAVTHRSAPVPPTEELNDEGNAFVEGDERPVLRYRLSLETLANLKHLISRSHLLACCVIAPAGIAVLWRLSWLRPDVTLPELQEFVIIIACFMFLMLLT